MELEKFGILSIPCSHDDRRNRPFLGEDVTGSIDANILPSPIVSVMGTPLLYDTALS
ncbi:uncharacterized protein CIMG_11557 [Coccidioides immitis RS]|uniref:Uncharacterized protein n=2 Tax=Coccidioides immitis TaxID=5501 RepID=A0A0D8JV32_COCIM|nr:uncharacterized protein CIMG_11557 [Coccidioides immitis RS]KJF61180.1 hypothetical protein CIMG_11557 [Coccidioides immitis RS]KMP05612.1 hypothetical protein CIRG_05293 [Coccidioides immitis RMSCC 2394]